MHIHLKVDHSWMLYLEMEFPKEMKLFLIVAKFHLIMVVTSRLVILLQQCMLS